MNLRIDEESYTYIWETLIEPQLLRYKESLDTCIILEENSKRLIWEEYINLNNYCRREYMVNPNGRLDRHKVAACYLIAIMHVSPIRFISVPLSDNSYFIVNAKIAITTAMSIVRAYVLAACDKLPNSEEIKKKFDNGLLYPPEEFVHHGNYINNYASEIYYANRDGKMHVLSIAHELFLLEVLTYVLS